MSGSTIPRSAQKEKKKKSLEGASTAELNFAKRGSHGRRGLASNCLKEQMKVNLLSGLFVIPAYGSLPVPSAQQATMTYRVPEQNEALVT